MFRTDGQAILLMMFLADGCPTSQWREYDPEDTLRFYALRLHEVGMIKSTPQKSSPRGPTGASSMS